MVSKFSRVPAKSATLTTTRRILYKLFQVSRRAIGNQLHIGEARRNTVALNGKVRRGLVLRCCSTTRAAQANDWIKRPLVVGTQGFSLNRNPTCGGLAIRPRRPVGAVDRGQAEANPQGHPSQAYKAAFRRFHRAAITRSSRVRASVTRQASMLLRTRLPTTKRNTKYLDQRPLNATQLVIGDHLPQQAQEHQ